MSEGSYTAEEMMTVAAQPDVLPLSIGDGELAQTASSVVSTPEVFRYWLQGGRIDVGFLGAAQIDRFGNINTTVIGDYRKPKIWLPGAGGASEIATSSGEVFVIVRQSKRTFVERLDFVTSVGSSALTEGQVRGVTRVITDLGILERVADREELILTSLHPGITCEQAEEATGWTLSKARALEQTPAPTASELATLRDLYARTKRAHSEPS